MLEEWEDDSSSKTKLREIMLKEKVRELEKQLTALNTLPVTSNFYEAVQINSCNVDDLVLAVYSDEHASYKIIHKTSNYLHFVHSVILKGCEHKLAARTSIPELAKASPPVTTAAATPSSPTTAGFETVTAEIAAATPPAAASALTSVVDDDMALVSVPAAETTSNWFIGKVIMKEFCIAKKVLPFTPSSGADEEIEN